MSIIVQKFGGTSLATAEARSNVIEHIKQAMSEFDQVVVVVSAMGRKGDPYSTDTLLDWVRQNGNALEAREKDLLLSCGELISATTLCSVLQSEGISAAVMNGAQAGIQTNEDFNNAKILSIDPKRIKHSLEQQKVVIVTGFQGQSINGELTTLGRGGSDTSATALGVALQANRVDIFTDVKGVLTADPKIVEDAKPLEQVTYTEICNMANHGAKVIHPRAVEVAMQVNLPIRIRSTFSKSMGTLVTGTEQLKQNGTFHDRNVTGIAHVNSVSQIQIRAAEGQYDLQLKVFKAMAQHHISVDFINVNPSGVVYTVFHEELERAIEILRDLGYSPECLPNCSKVSVIGGGMNGVPGIMAKIVESLTTANIPILQSADSNTTIWVLVHDEDMPKALRSLHKTFDLHK
jgi:aspartate kinase